MRKKLDLTMVEATKDGMTLRIEFADRYDFHGWKFTMLDLVKFLGVAVDNALEDDSEIVEEHVNITEALERVLKKRGPGRPKKVETHP